MAFWLDHRLLRSKHRLRSGVRVEHPLVYTCVFLGWHVQPCYRGLFQQHRLPKQCRYPDDPYYLEQCHGVQCRCSRGLCQQFCDQHLFEPTQHAIVYYRHCWLGLSCVLFNRPGCPNGRRSNFPCDLANYEHRIHHRYLCNPGLPNERGIGGHGVMDRINRHGSNCRSHVCFWHHGSCIGVLLN